jgi:hypothetical protein
MRYSDNVDKLSDGGNLTHCAFITTSWVPRARKYYKNLDAHRRLLIRSTNAYELQLNSTTLSITSNTSTQKTFTMSGTSNVGQASVYEAGDQRNSKDGENQPDRFHEGQENSHLAQDSSMSCHVASRDSMLTMCPEDERSIANKLAREAKREKEGEEQSEETILGKKDATLPARAHGNEPSKGAKIDQQLREEEEEELRRKGKK